MRENLNKKIVGFVLAMLLVLPLSAIAQEKDKEAGNDKKEKPKTIAELTGEVWKLPN